MFLPPFFRFWKLKKKQKSGHCWIASRLFLFLFARFRRDEYILMIVFFFLFQFRWICHSSCRDMQSATGIIPFLGIYLMGKLFRCCHVYHPGSGRQFIRPCYHKLWEKKIIMNFSTCEMRLGQNNDVQVFARLSFSLKLVDMMWVEKKRIDTDALSR